MPLDLDTADRLLAGTVAPEDAPPGYADVTRMLDAATAEATSEELEREAETVALIAATVRSFPHTEPSTPRRSFIPFALSRPRLAAALVAAGLACSAGLASAGALPGAAQEVASEMLEKVGISVPGPNEHAGDHPSVRGKSADEHATTGKGSDISELATTTELTGVEKGAAISTVASNGKSQAGQHGKSGAEHGSGGAAPVTTPNGGGTGIADIASGGKSSSGTATANQASNGASAASSGNASDGQETADTASGGHSSSGQSHRP